MHSNEVNKTAKIAWQRINLIKSQRITICRSTLEMKRREIISYFSNYRFIISRQGEGWGVLDVRGFSPD
jgi:hypothetical protein